jgi:hypothetical protein
MKYLKLYENFGKKLYSDIEGIDFSEKIELEQRYIDLIQKHLNEGFYVDTFGWCRIKYKGLPGRHSDFYCDIFQMDDYYFDLEILNTLDENYGKTIFNSYYYRCDGIDGLFQFLKDEKIITENPFE